MAAKLLAASKLDLRPLLKSTLADFAKINVSLWSPPRALTHCRAFAELNGCDRRVSSHDSASPVSLLFSPSGPFILHSHGGVSRARDRAVCEALFIAMCFRPVCSPLDLELPSLTEFAARSLLRLRCATLFNFLESFSKNRKTLIAQPLSDMTSRSIVGAHTLITPA